MTSEDCLARFVRSLDSFFETAEGTLPNFRTRIASIFHSAPTAREIRSTTIEREMKTWIMPELKSKGA